MSLKHIIKQLNKKNINPYNILLNYNGDDWKHYVHFNNYKYNPVSIYKNNQYELKLICWKSQQEVQVHNHKNEKCSFKVLENNITEYLYANTFEYKKTLIHNNKSVISREDSSYHAMKNTSFSNTITLHIYTKKI